MSIASARDDWATSDHNAVTSGRVRVFGDDEQVQTMPRKLLIRVTTAVRLGLGP